MSGRLVSCTCLHVMPCDPASKADAAANVDDFVPQCGVLLVVLRGVAEQVASCVGINGHACEPNCLPDLCNLLDFTLATNLYVLHNFLA